MIFVFPLVPILIGVFCLAFGLFAEIRTYLGAVKIILIIVNTAIFFGTMIHGLRNDISTTRKTWGVIMSIIGDFISTKALIIFMDALSSIELGIIEFLEFLFVLFVGGGLCYFVCYICLYITLKIVDNYW